MAKADCHVVAIVDDDAAVRDSLRFLLEVAGHKVQVFSKAADLLKADLQPVDCILLDHHMPNMTGLELTERLRAAGVTIPIMLITGAPTPAIVARAAELGIDRVVEKPPDEDEMLAFVNAAMGCP